MFNATLPQNYQSWPGPVACNLETRRGSFGDAEVNPITGQPRNFYGSLHLVGNWLIVLEICNVIHSFLVKMHWCIHLFFCWKISAVLPSSYQRNMVSSSCFLTAASQTVIICSRSSWGRFDFHLSAMLLLIYQCRDIYIIWRSQSLARHYLVYNNIEHYFINFYENQKKCATKNG